MPVLVRAGAIVVTQPPASFTAPGPAPRLILTVFPGSHGRFDLYDDAGLGFAYQHGAFARTLITHAGGSLTIGAARGHFSGWLRQRRWLIRLVGATRTLDTGPVSTRRALTVRL
jgi:alpha-D-xyloside xylohydrolase